MKKLYLFAILLFSSGIVFSQTALNVFNTMGRGYSTSVTSDYQCLGINPANLGWSFDNHMVTVGLLETGVTVYTNALTKTQLYNDLFNDNLNLPMSERIQAAKNFTDTRLWGQGGVTWLGLSVNINKIGGFAFSIRDRFLWNTVLNSEAAQFLFLGYHDPYFDSLAVNGGDTTGFSTHAQKASAVYDGTKIQFVWYREYNFGYGRKIVDKDKISVYAGIGIKYLTGYGSLQYYIDNGGKVDAYSSLGPEFSVDYGVPTPSKVEGNGLKRVGHGWGFDLGVTVELLKKIKVAVALNDIGSIKWDGNVYTASDVFVYKIATPGISNYNIFTGSQLIKTDGYPNEPSTWQGLESKTEKLPMHIRSGASWQIIPQVEIGMDLFIPLTTKVPGSFDKSIIGLGAMFNPIKWVQLSAGLVSGADVGTHVPLGISLFPMRNKANFWEIGVAVPDVLTLFKSEDIMTGISFGFIRLGFGKSGI